MSRILLSLQVYNENDQNQAFVNFESTLCEKLVSYGHTNVCSNGVIRNTQTCWTIYASYLIIMILLIILLLLLVILLSLLFYRLRWILYINIIWCMYFEIYYWPYNIFIYIITYRYENLYAIFFIVSIRKNLPCFFYTIPYSRVRYSPKDISSLHS